MTRVEKCTYGLVFSRSARLGPHDASLVVPVQLMPAWVELWVFRRAGGPVWLRPTGGGAQRSPLNDGWIVDGIVPAETSPDVGTVELAGFSDDGRRLRVVRATPTRRTLEVRLVADLTRHFP